MAEAGGSDKAGASAGGGVESLKDKGNEHFKAGNYLKAAALYTQAIKQDPNNPTLYRYIYLPPQNLFLFYLLVFSSFKFDIGSKCHFDWLATQFTWLIHLGSYWIWILLIISVWTCFVMNLISRNLKLCAFVYVEKQMNVFYCSLCLCVSFWTLPGDSWHLHFIICSLLIMMPRLHEYSFILFSAPRLRSIL